MVYKLSELNIRICDAISGVEFAKCENVSEPYITRCKQTGNGSLRKVLKIFERIRFAAQVEHVISRSQANELIRDICDAICGADDRVSVPIPQEPEQSFACTVRGMQVITWEFSRYLDEIATSINEASEEGSAFSAKEFEKIEYTGRRLIEKIMAFNSYVAETRIKG